MVDQQSLYNTKRASNPYVAQTVRTASKEKLILMLYQLGCQACARHDAAKANRVLSELIAALNFEYREMAIRFFDLYRYALDEVNAGRFTEAQNILKSLSTMWDGALVSCPKQ